MREILVDILFNADIKRMDLHFKGCLSISEFIDIFTTKIEAEKVAKMALLKPGAITKF